MRRCSPASWWSLTSLLIAAALPPVARADVKPTITKAVRGCTPQGCGKGIVSAPGVTTVDYDIEIINNDPLPVVFQFTDDIPASAVGFRVVNRGDGAACGSPGGPTCSNLPAPAGANGTGRIVIDGLSCGKGGAPTSRRRISYEIDFSCPPITPKEVVVNQAKVYTPARPTMCNPCVSDNPNTVDAPDDPTYFGAWCLQPPLMTVTKTPSVTVWHPGDPRTIGYKITMRNDSPTDTIPGQLVQLQDWLPKMGNGFPAFDVAATCPVQVTITPPAPITVDNTGCDRIQKPYIQIRYLPDIPPLATVELDMSVVMVDGLADQTEFCNIAQIVYWLGFLNVAGCTTVVWPQDVDFRSSVKTVLPEVVAPGQPLTYTLTIANTGSGTATNTIVTDVLDGCLDASSFDVASVAVSPGPVPLPATYDAPSRTLHVPLGTMDPAEVQTITIPGLLGGSEAICCNQARVTSDQIPAPGQSTGASSGSGGTATCTGPRTVSFTSSIKAMSPSPVESRGPITYTITVTNSGSTVANNVVVSDILPTCVDDSMFDPVLHVSATPAAPTSVNYNRPARLLEVKLLAVPPQSSAVVTIAGFLAGPAVPACCNQAFVSSEEVPLPGDATGNSAGSGDLTCGEIVPRPGCDLNRATVALGGPRIPPWVYTNNCSIPERLPGPPLVTAVVTDAVIDASAGTPAAELALYELDCPCTDVIRLWMDRGTSPPSVRLRF